MMKMEKDDVVKKSRSRLSGIGLRGFFYVIVLMVVSSCIDKDIVSKDGASENLSEVVVPEDFTFETSQNVDILILDEYASGDVKYNIYSFGSDTLNDLIASGVVDGSGQFKTSVVLPSFLEKVYLVRNQKGKFIGKELAIANKKIEYTYDNSGNRTGRSMRNAEGCSELLYVVNSKGDFFTIDNESGLYNEERLSDLAGGGSIACAVDRANRIVYYNTGTTLRYYDINAETFEVAHEGNPFNGSYPRMEYNNTNGLLYIAKNEKMYIVDPTNNVIVSSIAISGIQSPVGGGDVAISLDGTIYMCTFSGLYRIDVAEEGNSAQATRISAENLPFKPTSMAIDRNDRLYLATNDSNSKLIEMDKFDGAWSVIKVYDHTINDLGSLPCSLDELDDIDTDGDGVNDPLDEYPEDPGKAATNYTPSKYGWGSLAFEDLWPAKGDFDFNDLVVSYRFIAIADASNNIVELEAIFNVRAIGASFKNGFGFQLPIDAARITEVTGYQLTTNIVRLDAKGLEFGQEKPVIIVFDNAFDHLPHVGGSFINTEMAYGKSEAEDIVIKIKFDSPVDPSELGTAPFNPFIFINGERGKEVHLKNMEPTSLADAQYFGTLDDASNPEENKYYSTSNYVPWAINIIHEFRYPIEKEPVNSGYNFFIQWSTSAGSNYSDWYKDNSGYRNTNRLYTK